MDDPIPSFEIERLKRQVEELKQQLADKQPKNLPALIKDEAFIEDMARFSAGILTEAHLRMKYHLVDEAMWEHLGNDSALIERIQLAVVRRLRSGATKRELAQNRIVAAPEMLNTIMSDPHSNPRHKVDAVKALDALADPGPQRATDGDRVIITIDLGGGHVQTFGKGIDLDDGDLIDVTPAVIAASKREDGGGDGNAL